MCPAIHAAGCALHRHTSRVIHRLELFVPRALTATCGYFGPRRPRNERTDEWRRKGAERRCDGAAVIVDGDGRTVSLNLATRELPCLYGTGTPPQNGNSEPAVPAALWAGRSVCDTFFDSAHNAAAHWRSVMILPQVHLRKPCYDFYSLKVLHHYATY